MLGYLFIMELGLIFSMPYIFVFNYGLFPQLMLIILCTFLYGFMFVFYILGKKYKNKVSIEKEQAKHFGKYEIYNIECYRPKINDEYISDPNTVTKELFHPICFNKSDLHKVLSLDNNDKITIHVKF